MHMNIIIGCLFSGWIDRHACSWVRREPRFKLLIDGQDYSSRAASQGIGAVSAIGQGGAVDSLDNYRIYGLVEDCLGAVVDAGQVDRVLDMKPLTSCQSLLRSQVAVQSLACAIICSCLLCCIYEHIGVMISWMGNSTYATVMIPCISGFFCTQWSCFQPIEFSFPVTEYLDKNKNKKNLPVPKQDLFFCLAAIF